MEFQMKYATVSFSLGNISSALEQQSNVRIWTDQLRR